MEIHPSGPTGAAAIPQAFSAAPTRSAAAGGRAGQAAAAATGGRQAQEPPAASSLAAQSSFWDLLTPDEREFFEKQASLGPITYRPGGRPSDAMPAPTGQRIDVRG
ncbi:MAG: hypothetical protein ACE15D_10745 [Candidatus Eisenbacteria bacterium]